MIKNPDLGLCEGFKENSMEVGSAALNFQSNMDTPILPAMF